MIDDWSLKDRVVIDKQVEPNESWFAKSTIDILRQKLIEELCSEFLECGDRASNDNIPQKKIYKTINKLFGVDK